MRLADCIARKSIVDADRKTLNDAVAQHMKNGKDQATAERMSVQEMLDIYTREKSSVERQILEQHAKNQPATEAKGEPLAAKSQKPAAKEGEAQGTEGKTEGVDEAAVREPGAGGEAQPSILERPTPDDIRAREQQRADAERADRVAADKAKVDAEPYVLTGSNRTADQAEARGQGSIFDAPIQDGLSAAEKVQSDLQHGKLNANPIEDVSKAARKLLIADEAIESVTKFIKGLYGGKNKGAAKDENTALAAGRFMISSTGQRLRTLAKISGIKEIEDVANMVQRQPGSGKEIAEPFGEAVMRNSTAFINRMLGGRMDEMGDWWGKTKRSALPDLQQIRALVQNRGQIAGKRGTLVGDVAQQWADGLDALLKYAQDNGVPVMGVKDGFFPRMVDASKLTNDAAFERFKTKTATLYRGLGLSVDEAEKAANAYAYAKRMEGFDINQTPMLDLTSGLPTTAHIKHREFGKAADSLLAEFMVENPIDALRIYTMQMVRRAEFESRFGYEKHKPNGEPIGISRYQAIRNAVMKQGGEHMVGRMDDYVQAAVGNVGGKDVARNAGTVLSSLSNIVFLTHSALTSIFSEPAAMAASIGKPVTGTLDVYGKMLVGALEASAKNFLGMDTLGIPLLKDAAQARRLAQALGAIEVDAAYSALHAVQADGEVEIGPVGKGRKIAHAMTVINSRAMQAYGIKSITDIERGIMAKLGDHFVREMILDGGTLAKRELRDLGVKDAEMLEFRRYVHAKSINEAIAEAGGSKMAQRYLQAVNATIQRGVQSATRGDKPLLASHPLGRVIYSLQGFLNAYHNNYLKRVQRLITGAATEKGLTSEERAKMVWTAASIPISVATAMVGYYIRDELTGKDEEKKDKQDMPAVHLGHEMPWSNRVERAVSGSGVMGKYDPWFNLATGARYKRSPAQQATGPYAGSMQDLFMDTFAMINNEGNGNSSDRKVAKGVFEVLLAPALESAALMAGGPLAATVIPQAMTNDKIKNSFVDSVAGEKGGETWHLSDDDAAF